MIKQQKPLIVVSAAKLIAEYNANESSADEKYKENLVEITGDFANAALIQETIGIYLENNKIVCLVDKSQGKTISRFTRGQTVTYNRDE